MIETARWITLAALCLVPLFRVYGEYGRAEAQAALLILLSAAGCLAVGCACRVPMPGTPGMVLLALAGYSAASLMWCDRPRPAGREVARLGATAALVALVSVVQREWVMVALVAPIPVVMLLAVWQQVTRRDLLDHRWDEAYRKASRFIAHLDSTNHVGHYLAPLVFLSGWLALTVHPSFFGLATLAALGVLMSRCVGAWIAVSLGGVAVFGSPVAVMVAVLVATAGVTVAVRSGRFESFGHRYLLARVAIQAIIETRGVGGGPRFFRRKFSRIVGAMNERDPSILGNEETPGRYSYIQGRRAHNDWVETGAEYGVVGVLLLAGVFGTLLMGSDHPVILGAVVSVIVSTVLFYPLRDAAISLPFIALVGTAGPGGFASFHPWVLLTAVPAILLIVHQHAVKPFWASLAFARKDCWTALRHDPCNGRYLAHAVVLLVAQQKDLGTAMAFAQRSILEYDGEVLEHMAYDTYGKVALLSGAVPLAHKAFQLAVAMRPGDKGARRELRRTTAIMKQLRGEAHGEPAGDSKA